MPKLLRTMTEWTKVRCRIERVDQRGADEAFVRSQILQLTVNKGEQFFFERRFAQSRVIANRGDSVIDFFFEEGQGDVFF